MGGFKNSSLRLRSQLKPGSIFCFLSFAENSMYSVSVSVGTIILSQITFYRNNLGIFLLGFSIARQLPRSIYRKATYYLIMESLGQWMEIWGCDHFNNECSVLNHSPISSLSSSMLCFTYYNGPVVLYRPAFCILQTQIHLHQNNNGLLNWALNCICLRAHPVQWINLVMFSFALTRLQSIVYYLHK